ncbi:MAG: methionine--tRNA ligase subunit beta [Planctomycetota bacterium]
MAETIQFDDFLKLEIRVATVLKCEAHSNADKLLILQVDLGSEQRQIVAGLRGYYEPEDLPGKQIVVVTNLAARMMRGQESQGMLLAGISPDRAQVVVLTPDKALPAGSTVS